MADVIFPGKTPTAVLGTTSLPNNVDLAIWQGDAFTYDVALAGEGGAAIALDGYVPAAMIRESFTAVDKFNIACTVVNGKVRLYLSSAISKTIPAGNYVWNFQLTAPNGDVRTYLAGDVTVHAEVDH